MQNTFHCNQDTRVFLLHGASAHIWNFAFHVTVESIFPSIVNYPIFNVKLKATSQFLQNKNLIIAHH